MESNESEFSKTPEKQLANIQKQLLEAALTGQGVYRPLMIGDTIVEEGVTFEVARDELNRLIDGGFIELNTHWRPQLTEKGIERLAGL